MNETKTILLRLQSSSYLGPFGSYWIDCTGSHPQPTTFDGSCLCPCSYWIFSSAKPSQGLKKLASEWNPLKQKRKAKSVLANAPVVYLPICVFLYLSVFASHTVLCGRCCVTALWPAYGLFEHYLLQVINYRMMFPSMM